MTRTATTRMAMTSTTTISTAMISQATIGALLHKSALKTPAHTHATGVYVCSKVSAETQQLWLKGRGGAGLRIKSVNGLDLICRQGYDRQGFNKAGLDRCRECGS